MIEAMVNGQSLTVYHPIIAADSIQYLTAQFTFSDDWTGAAKFAHFTQAEQHLEPIMLDGDKITKDKQLNLTEGVWEMYLHGNLPDGTRITTDVQEIEVVPTGTLNGEVLPDVQPSVAEQIAAKAEEANAKSDEAIRIATDAKPFAERAEAAANKAEASQTAVQAAQADVNKTAVNVRANAQTAQTAAQSAELSMNSASASQTAAEQSASTADSKAQAATTSAEQAQAAQAAAKQSADNASAAAAKAVPAAGRAEQSASTAAEAARNAEASAYTATQAKASAEAAQTGAQTAETNAQANSTAAEQSAQTASTAAEQASKSKTQAAESAAAAKTSEQNASETANKAVDAYRQEANDTFANAIKKEQSGVIISAKDISPVEHDIDCYIKSKNRSIDSNFTFTRRSKLHPIDGFLDAGKPFTLSFVPTFIENPNDFRFYIRWFGKGGFSDYIGLASVATPKKSKEIVSTYVSTPSPAYFFDIEFAFWNTENPVFTETKIDKIQIEPGDKVTKYYPNVQNLRNLPVYQSGENLLNPMVFLQNGLQKIGEETYQAKKPSEIAGKVIVDNSSGVGGYYCIRYDVKYTAGITGQIGKRYGLYPRVYYDDGTFEDLKVSPGAYFGIYEGFEARSETGKTVDKIIWAYAEDTDTEIRNFEISYGYDVPKEFSPFYARVLTTDDNGVIKNGKSLYPIMVLSSGRNDLYIYTNYNADANKINRLVDSIDHKNNFSLIESVSIVSPQSLTRDQYPSGRNYIFSEIMVKFKFAPVSAPSYSFFRISINSRRSMNSKDMEVRVPVDVNKPYVYFHAYPTGNYWCWEVGTSADDQYYDVKKMGSAYMLKTPFDKNDVITRIWQHNDHGTLTYDAEIIAVE